MDYYHYTPTKQIDTTRRSDPAALTNWLNEGNKDNSIYQLCMCKALPDIMNTELTDTQKMYIEMRFYRYMRLEDIAYEMGVDRSTVSRTIKRGLTNMKKALAYVYFGAKIGANADEY